MKILTGTDFTGVREVNFTLGHGTRESDIGVQMFIEADEVNEAQEAFVFVLEITDTGGNAVNLDDEAGVLIFTILDNNRESNTVSV